MITEYAYDALGRRIEVTDHVSTADMCGDASTPVRTRQVYSGLETIQEYVWCATAGEWTAAREFLYGASFLEPVVLVDWSDMGDEAAGTEEVLHYVHDRLGSVVALTDAGDPDAQPTPIPPKAVERYEYDPYGQTYIETWDDGSSQWVSASESKYGNQLLWTAQRYDATVGLYHFPARAYSPRLGRWLQRDPLGYVDGVNLYEYVRSAVTVLIDPLGMQSAPNPCPPPDWPLPPEWTDDWKWKPNPKPPGERGDDEDPGHWRDPDHSKWRWHPEDDHHNPHWDKRPRKGKKERVPVDGKPPIKPKPPEPKAPDPAPDSKDGDEEDKPKGADPAADPEAKPSTAPEQKPAIPPPPTPIKPIPNDDPSTPMPGPTSPPLDEYALDIVDAVVDVAAPAAVGIGAGLAIGGAIVGGPVTAIGGGIAIGVGLAGS